jgi:hypothetical protein
VKRVPTIATNGTRIKNASVINARAVIPENTPIRIAQLLYSVFMVYSTPCLRVAKYTATLRKVTMAIAGRRRAFKEVFFSSEIPNCTEVTAAC